MINKLQLIQLNGDITSIYNTGGKARHVCLLEILDVAKIPPVVAKIPPVTLTP